jgi:septin family protein
MLAARTLRMVSRSSPSLLVGATTFLIVCIHVANLDTELELDEEGTRISLTIVDTPGFGDQIDNEASFSEIVGYLERQYDDILAEESRIKRNPRFRDNRVHAMLYFITPTGHGYVFITPKNIRSALTIKVSENSTSSS